MLKLVIIAVSTRPGRAGGPVSKWFDSYARRDGRFDVGLVDLQQINLPLFDETNHPVLQQYENEHTKNFASLIDPADAFVFVTPEYDYFTPAPLVNAIDYLSREWSYKPAGLVGYGGISGGLRSIQATKPLMTSVKMMPIPDSVSIQFFKNHIEGDVFTPERKHEDMAKLMLDDLLRWAEALRPLHKS